MTPPPGQPEALGKISVGNKWKEKQNQNLRLIEMETAKKKAQCQQSAKIFFHDNGNKRVMWVGCSHRKKNAAEPQQKTRKHTKWKFRPAVEITATEMVPFFPRIGAPKGGDWHLPPLAIHIAGGEGQNTNKHKWTLMKKKRQLHVTSFSSSLGCTLFWWRGRRRIFTWSEAKGLPPASSQPICLFVATSWHHFLLQGYSWPRTIPRHYKQLLPRGQWNSPVLRRDLITLIWQLVHLVGAGPFLAVMHFPKRNLTQSEVH